MRINLLSSNCLYYTKRNKGSDEVPSFGCAHRQYLSKNGDFMATNSWMFRDDVDWKRLASYEKWHFIDKKKVNIINIACADGSEAYTKIITLKERMGDDAQKFLPIKAYDIDDEILNAANSGLLNTSQHDRLELQINTENYEDYFGETSEKLIIQGDTELKDKKTMKVKNSLKSAVRFEKADMYDVVKNINDDSNTILMCRNVLGYFEENKVESFVKLVSNRLKEGSLFIIGEHDTKNSQIVTYLGKNGFTKVMENVYKKSA